MVVVLVSSRYKTLLEWITSIENENIKHIGVIKKVGPKIYLYFDTSLSQNELHHTLKKQIVHSGGLMYVYELYGVFNGMIDYNSYMSEETKQSMKYYQTSKKDIDDQEIENYRKTHLK